MDKMICLECSEEMVYDFVRDEYYCPLCGYMNQTQYKPGLKYKQCGLSWTIKNVEGIK